MKKINKTIKRIFLLVILIGMFTFLQFASKPFNELNNQIHSYLDTILSSPSLSSAT